MKLSYKYKLALWLLNRMSRQEQTLLYLALVWRIQKKAKARKNISMN